MDVEIVYVKCPICEKAYALGYNGVGDSCDACAGIERDLDGCAWQPGETEHQCIDLQTGEGYVLTRQEAFTTGDVRIKEPPYPANGA